MGDGGEWVGGWGSSWYNPTLPTAARGRISVNVLILAVLNTCFLVIF